MVDGIRRGWWPMIVTFWAALLLPGLFEAAHPLLKSCPRPALMEKAPWPQPDSPHSLQHAPPQKGLTALERPP